MSSRMPLEIGGYVLAGGKSSRMGQDKALLELAGKPLVWHAVTKLRRVCQEVHILSSNPELDAYAPLVPDLHASCGPLGGMEAGLKHSRYDWNLFTPVDMPFLPSALLDHWASEIVLARQSMTRIAMFSVDGLPQPALCLLHRDVVPFVSSAIEQGRYKLFSALEEAAEHLAARHGVLPERLFLNLAWNEMSGFSTNAGGKEDDDAWRTLTKEQQASRRLWFTNLNTPEEFTEAERHVDALDT